MSFNKKCAKALLFSTLFASFNVAAATANYSPRERFLLTEDKLKTQDFLKGFGHDFYLDINASASADLPDLVSDASDVEDENEAIEVLQKYDNTEQTLRVNVGIGVPLPSWTMFGAKIKPSFRISTEVGSLFAIDDEKVFTSTFLNAVEMDQTLKTAIEGEFSQDELTTYLTGVSTGGATVCADPCTATDFVTNYMSGLTAPEQAAIVLALESQFGSGGQLPFSNSGATAPLINTYTKVDAKAGINFDWAKNNKNGFLNVYGMYRADLFKVIDQNSLGSGEDLLGDVENHNATLYLMTDIGYGFNWLKYFDTRFTIEDIKLSTITERDEESTPLLYEPTILYRAQQDYTFKWGFTKVKAFAGIHYRDGYDFADGVYAGADFMLHAWDERLFINARAMVDSEYLTLAPSFKLWLIDLQYSLKQPVKDEIDGMKISSIHSLNASISF